MLLAISMAGLLVVRGDAGLVGLAWVVSAGFTCSGVYVMVGTGARLGIDWRRSLSVLRGALLATAAGLAAAAAAYPFVRSMDGDGTAVVLFVIGAIVYLTTSPLTGALRSDDIAAVMGRPISIPKRRVAR
jgi:hypothetical protein